MAYANVGCYRLKVGSSAAVHNFPFSHDFNGWPYNRQAHRAAVIKSCARSLTPFQDLALLQIQPEPLC